MKGGGGSGISTFQSREAEQRRGDGPLSNPAAEPQPPGSERVYALI